jgi:hypothetical protein
METLEQVKQAVKDGNQVNWQGGAYTVIIGNNDQFMIKHSGGNCVGLTDEYKPEDFFISKSYEKRRLEYLRGELRAERMSYAELAELQSLAKFIDKDDVELLEAAGVPEFDE